MSFSEVTADGISPLLLLGTLGGDAPFLISVWADYDADANFGE